MDNRTEKRRLGDFGESIATKFLMKHGFTILDRNYNKPWGEIDLIAKKGDEVHFVEVKSAVSYETGDSNTETVRPEDNIHPAKLKRMHRAIQTYCLEKDIDMEKVFVDAIIVKISPDHTKAKVVYIDNIVL